MHTQSTQNSRGAVTDCSILVPKIISIWSQVLGPIRRPLTASFNSNIRRTLKMRIKLKYGETPTSRSLRKLPKSCTHAKPSPRRTVLLLVPKTANGWITCISRKKLEVLSLKLKFSIYWFSPLHFTFLLLLYLRRQGMYTILSSSDLNNSQMPIMSLHFSDLIFGTISAVHFYHFSTYTTYGT